jgi:hypothetical protein
MTFRLGVPIRKSRPEPEADIEAEALFDVVAIL